MQNLRISEECYVDVISDSDEPQGVAEQRGDKPVAAYQNMVEEQLNEVKDHQQRKECAEKGICFVDNNNTNTKRIY